MLYNSCGLGWLLWRGLSNYDFLIVNRKICYIFLFNILFLLYWYFSLCLGLGYGRCAYGRCAYRMLPISLGRTGMLVA